MNMLSRFIDSLTVKFHASAFQEVLSPAKINGIINDHNVIVHLNKGHLVAGRNEEEVKPESFYFFPQGQRMYAWHGEGPKYTEISNEDGEMPERTTRCIRSFSGLSDTTSLTETITIIRFDLILYNAFPFFPLLDMPSFPLSADNEFAYLVRHIALEEEQNKLGRDKIISNYMEEIVIHMCRYIESKPALKKYFEKLEFLTDKRLIDIVHYIQDNLEKDLSNRSIANVAFVSEDYVGQFFKSLTSRNLQEYIENQRLEKAFQLLKSEPDNVQEIAHKVGFKDPAYFSRRFKMKFGSNAIAVRSDNKNYVV
jgi:AraC-like DNA-binding protein